MRTRRDPQTRAIAFGAESGRCRWRAPISTRIETAKSFSPAATLDVQVATATVDVCRAGVFLLWGCRLISLVLSVLRRRQSTRASQPADVFVPSDAEYALCLLGVSGNLWERAAASTYRVFGAPGRSVAPGVSGTGEGDGGARCVSARVLAVLESSRDAVDECARRRQGARACGSAPRRRPVCSRLLARAYHVVGRLVPKSRRELNSSHLNSPKRPRQARAGLVRGEVSRTPEGCDCSLLLVRYRCMPNE